jgi:hypothetical protein
MGYSVENLSKNPEIRINRMGWLVLTYPQSEDAILILKTPIQKSEFLNDCGVDSIEQITDIPLKYYRLASCQIQARYEKLSAKHS